jgi:hypothetical protein
LPAGALAKFGVIPLKNYHPFADLLEVLEIAEEIRDLTGV